MSDVDDYLATLPQAERAALERLRKIIRSAAPEATEKISYRMPMFFHQGGLVSFAAFKNHCSLFVMSTRVVKALKADLDGYSTAKGTVHFTVDDPLPAALVKKVVKARMAENEANTKRKEKKPAAKSKLKHKRSKK